ncbi:glycosyltransferase family 10 [Sulfitobacter sp. W074]|uniref:glycosyltransferase family 10 n=1 Tax=Sulfitobacter sp. W074 TaxID=2867026 RepID=UPI0021A5C8EE|nr:glycosyltransferase family 10 [Sulfitobacter sp. W074]UWR39643.1 hypothetical protein K3762_19335 [Sulfitobacter sp. W074]
MSNKTVSYAHRLRRSMILDLYEKGECDLYGVGFHPVPTKRDLYCNYRYAFCIENSAEEGYFSEKLGDVLIAGAIPVYWGAGLPPGFVDDAVIVLEEISAREFRTKKDRFEALWGGREHELAAAVAHNQRHYLANCSFWRRLKEISLTMTSEDYALRDNVKLIRPEYEFSFRARVRRFLNVF